MITEIVAILTSVLTAIFGGGAIYLWRENKAIKRAEAENEQIKNLSLVNDEWQETLSQCDKDREYYRNLCAQKDAQIESLNESRLSLQNKINELTLDVAKLKWCKCTMNGCKNRRPPRDYELDEQE